MASFFRNTLQIHYQYITDIGKFSILAWRHQPMTSRTVPSFLCRRAVKRVVFTINLLTKLQAPVSAETPVGIPESVHYSYGQAIVSCKPLSSPAAWSRSARTNIRFQPPQNSTEKAGKYNAWAISNLITTFFCLQIISVSCDFENGVCDWLSVVEGSWALRPTGPQGDVHKGPDGPVGDHTYSPHQDGGKLLQGGGSFVSRVLCVPDSMSRVLCVPDLVSSKIKRYFVYRFPIVMGSRKPG
jgi:hypothetical protein